MTMMDRVRNLLVQPKEEWQRIDAEPVETVDFYRSYIVIGIVNSLFMGGPVGMMPLRGRW